MQRAPELFTERFVQRAVHTSITTCAASTPVQYSLSERTGLLLLQGSGGFGSCFATMWRGREVAVKVRLPVCPWQQGS